jgi:hypothetical protein
MLFTLRVLSLLAFAFGLFMFMGARSAIHEIEGLICFLIGAITLSSSFIIYTIQKDKTC